MATTRLCVFCYLPGEVAAVPAGRFDHDGVDRVGLFAYGRRYANRPGALAVDGVALPLGADPMPVATNGGLYGAFRDASPDHWGRLVIASGLTCPVEALSEIDYLSHANATRVGNLDFRPSLDSPEPTLGPPEFQDIEDLLIAAEGLGPALGRSSPALSAHRVQHPRAQYGRPSPQPRVPRRTGRHRPLAAVRCGARADASRRGL